MQGLSHQSIVRPKSGQGIRAIGLLALVAAGCSPLAPSALDLPEGALAVPAPAEYGAWFAKTEACSGLRGQIEAVQWFVVPNAETFETKDGPKVGMWEKSGGQAVIVIAGRYANHEMVVRHELLHHLLDREGHPAQYFVDRCRLTWDSWQGD